MCSQSEMQALKTRVLGGREKMQGFFIEVMDEKKEPRFGDFAITFKNASKKKNCLENVYIYTYIYICCSPRSNSDARHFVFDSVCQQSLVIDMCKKVYMVTTNSGHPKCESKSQHSK